MRECVKAGVIGESRRQMYSDTWKSTMLPENGMVCRLLIELRHRLKAVMNDSELRIKALLSYKIRY